MFTIISCILFGLLFFTLFLHTPIFIIRLRAKIWRSIGLAFRLLMAKPFRVLLSGVIFFGVMIVINGLYLLLVGIPAWLGYSSLAGFFTTEILELLFAVYVLIVSLIWALAVIPFFGVMSLLFLIQHYRQHLHPIVELPEMGEVDNQEGPLFQLKRE